MTTQLTTPDGDVLPEGTKPTGVHCYECDNTDGHIGVTDECPECLSPDVELVVVSNTPLLGTPADAEYFHHGHGDYVYSISE